jgi:hypothetical protein
MSRATIERLYGALARLDGAAMQACYAEQARFEDEVFRLDGRRQIGGMWRMLCEAAQARGPEHWKIETRDIAAAQGKGSAHWEARYLFSATGRPVLNRIDAEFEFGARGLILMQRDRFDFWRWARQALGPPGLLLGWTPLLRARVRAQAAVRLERYLARH